ncbi:hypothetical protein MUO66_01090 [Candidatus Bathyarchaeota archaeon]|nr:hypothetical protein [Candidatus Bathyarchaeota archaeon]
MVDRKPSTGLPMISISKFEISVGLVDDTSKIGAFIDSEIVLAKFLVFSVLDKKYYTYSDK